MSVHFRKEATCLTVRIDRRDTLNAINFEVMDRLEEILDDAETDPKLRLFILTGTGKSFISGGDLREFHQINDAEGAKKMSERMITILDRIRQLPCWTLAAINGHTYGGGWEVMLSFDFRVACTSATFGFTQGKFYLPPGWGGIAKLTKTAGQSLARYWLASQKVISSQTALQTGLIQEIFEDAHFNKNVEELKEKLILNDRTFIEYIKQSEQHQNTEDEIEPFSEFWESEEHKKRVNEFLKRKK